MKGTLFVIILPFVLGLGTVASQTEEMEPETRVYWLSKNLLEETKPLENADVKFPEGTGAEFDPHTGLLTIVHFEPQFAEIEFLLDLIFTEADPLRNPGMSLHIIHERIEVDHIEFSDWFLENTMSGDGTELRHTVQEWAREGRATIVDTTTISCRSGQRAKTRSGEEVIYPTEPGVPEIPNQLELSGKNEAPIVARAASAFETRYLGIILEVDPVIGYDEVTVDLNLAPYFTALEKLNHIQSKPEGNPSAVDMPTFHTQRITTQVTLLDGHYAFLGTTQPHEAVDVERKHPIILNFVRADVGRVLSWKRVK